PRGVTDGLVKDVREGWEYTFSDRRLALVIVLVIFHCGLTMAFDSMMPALAEGVGGGERTFSAILIGLGFGAVVGTITISKLPSEAMQGRALLVAGLGSGVAMLVLGMATVPALVVFGALLAGGTQAAYMSLSQVLVLGITPDRMRGRVMATFIMVAAGHMAFVNLGFGATADIVGVRPLLIVPAIAWTAIFATALFALPELRLLVRTGRFLERATPAPAAAAGG
ncbi:MAG: MFS transporter, partial [Dehalococcoidia bacterium]